MKIIYCGCGKFGIDSLNALKASAHDLCHVITHPAKTAGRGRKLRPNDIEKWAFANSIPLTAIEDINSPAGAALIKKIDPDLLVVIAFGQKISDQIINIPPKGAVNVHGSLLPKYRGAAPINWAIINGEKTTGVTIITLAQQMDAGSMLAKAELKINDSDTAKMIHDKLAAIAAPLLIETIDKIAAGSQNYQTQDNAKATKAPKLKKSDGFINFSESAQQIHNKVRGLWPWPGAAACFVNADSGKQTTVIIAKTKVVDLEQINNKPGAVDENSNILCRRGSLKILELKPQGGKIMNFKSFLNGRGSRNQDYFVQLRDKNQ